MSAMPLSSDATVARPRSATAPSESAVLVVLADRPQIVPLQSEIVIGRDASAELTIDDGSVSRRHARVTQTTRGFQIHDLGSTNGTLVNGQAVAEIDLEYGDRIELGDVTLKLLAEDDAEVISQQSILQTLDCDPLTGASNRGCFDRQLARLLQAGSETIGLVLLDLDHFKAVNDTHGHPVGDAVLQEAVVRLQSIADRFGSGVHVARYGGEEFALLGQFPAGCVDSAIELATVARVAIADPAFETAVGPLAVTASFGVAIASIGRATAPGELIARADAALYRSKQAGRNRVMIADA